MSRTTCQESLADEIVLRFTHTISMDRMPPGIPPTGKRVEVAFLVVVQFDGDNMVHEHLFWDEASRLVQLGLLEPGGLPAAGFTWRRGSSYSMSEQSREDAKSRGIAISPDR